MANVRPAANLNRPEQTSSQSVEPLSVLLKSDSTLRIGMLNNPLSGGNRKGLQKIREAAAAVRSEVLQEDVQTPSDVAAALADFARREVNILVINGGDGTVQAALTAIFHKKFFETNPLLAVLRSAGTTSMIAGDVGLKGSRESALQNLFSWAQARDGTATVAQRPVLKVQVPPENEPVYGMFFGAAAIYQATHFCLQKVHTRGLRGELGAGVALARFLLAVFLRDRKVVSAVPITTRLNQDPPESKEYLLVLITTLQRLFLGLRPYWGSESKPLHFTAVGARPRHFMRVLPSLMRGDQSHHVKPINGYLSQNVDEVQLTLGSGFNLDGELHMPDSRLGPVRITHGGTASFLQL
jgi:diacylglycerol kinase family enzyme